MEVQKVKRGVLFDPRDQMSEFPSFQIRQDPLYIVDLLENPYEPVTTATFFNIDKNSLRKYHKSKHNIIDVCHLVKAHQKHEHIYHPYGKYPDTPLSKLAAKMNSVETYYTDDVKPPVFSSIVSMGTDSFTHEYTRVIAEREPKTTRVSGGIHHNMPETLQPLTHVKIALSNLLITKSYIPPKWLFREILASSNLVVGATFNYLWSNS